MHLSTLNVWYLSKYKYGLYGLLILKSVVDIYPVNTKPLTLISKQTASRECDMLGMHYRNYVRFGRALKSKLVC